MTPAYLQLTRAELEQRADKAWGMLNRCVVCPRVCRADRIHHAPSSECQAGALPMVYSAHPHFGEESCLVGRGGSGTIFMGSCNLACVFCQNWEISQGESRGMEVGLDVLAAMMLSLQRQGCSNINFVSPTIWIPQIIKSLLIARENGLRLPLVYNTAGYDSVAALRLLDGIVDIYMPDIKYSDDTIGLKYSQVPHYWRVVRRAVREMHRQVGDLTIDSHGLATRGMLIRHLVMPDDIAGTEQVMAFIASLSTDSFVNIMAQYHPANKAADYAELNRRITGREFETALNMAREAGLHRFDKDRPRIIWRLF